MISVTEALLRRAPESRRVLDYQSRGFLPCRQPNQCDTRKRPFAGRRFTLAEDSAGRRTDHAAHHSNCAGAPRRVTVKCVRGNHDPHAGYTLAMIRFPAYYESGAARGCRSRSRGAFWYRTWGRKLSAFATGIQSKKVDDLPSIMAADCPVEWGAARHRRWLLRHFHNSSMKEHRGCSVEIFRTLAPADAWTQASGYQVRPSLQC